MSQKTVLCCIASCMLSFCLSVPYASAEYMIVDREGRQVNKKQDEPVTVTAADRKVLFNGIGGKVFEVEWDAKERMLTVKGEKVYLRIHGDGRVEKLTTMRDVDQGQPPLVIQPIVPVRTNPQPATAPAK